MCQVSVYHPLLLHPRVCRSCVYMVFFCSFLPFFPYVCLPLFHRTFVSSVSLVFQGSVLQPFILLTSAFHLFLPHDSQEFVQNITPSISFL